jgi:TIR domain
MPSVCDDNSVRVFVSYSRRDALVADALVDVLKARGFNAKIDRRNLPFGEKWQAELAELIRLSDTVIWLVSDASIRSQWVNWELDEVAKRKKRLVPVLIGDTSRDKLPRQLGEIQLLPAEGLFDVKRDLDVLVQVLEADQRWLKEASRLADRAHEWLAKGQTSSLLLRGATLDAADRWKESRPPKVPAPHEEVLELILASRHASTLRQRRWMGGALAVALGAIGLAGYAYLQRATALATRDDALIRESKYLADRSAQVTAQQQDQHPAYCLPSKPFRTQTVMTRYGDYVRNGRARDCNWTLRGAQYVSWR